MYIFCFLERWNFIVSIHERKWILPYRFICGGSIITNNLGKTCFLILTKSEHNQNHYTEFAHGAILMEQNMKFGLILGRFTIQKKNGVV